MFIPEYVRDILDRLAQSGEKGYTVGGCVRDSLLGKTPSDYDVTTGAEPDRVKEIFSDYKIIETGLRHGTVTVLSRGRPVEITTFRREGKYSDNRRPDSVSFVKSVEEDLSRRDFTINAMACSADGGITDLFGGRRDLENGVIRCVGDPVSRFEEDALRIMRALRFASVLGFTIEPETERAAFECRQLLENISAERIASELIKLLCGRDAGRITEKYIDILAVRMPELLPMKDCAQKHPYHIYGVLGHTARVIDAADSVPHLRLAALLHDCGKPCCRTTDEKGIDHFFGHPARSAEIAGRICERLRLDRSAAERCTELVRLHDMRLDGSEKAVKKCLARLGGELFFDLLKLKRADFAGQAPDKLYRIKQLDEIEKTARRILESGECLSLGNLGIGGSELIALGFEQGPDIGRTLERLLDEVLEGKLQNESTALKERALQMLEEKI